MMQFTYNLKSCISMQKYALILICLLFPSLVSAGDNTVIYSKNLGSGIIMEQTDTKTLIKLKWRTLLSYSNESKKVPFIWDEWCSLYTEKIIKESSDNNIWTQKQKIWDSLWGGLQKQCMREQYQKVIQVSKIAGTNRFLELRKSWYEWADSTVIDLITKATQHIGEAIVEKVIAGKSGTYIQTNESKWDCHGNIYLVNLSGKFISQFSMCKIAKNTDTTILTSFELLANRRFQVTYVLNEKTITQIYTVKTK